MEEGAVSLHSITNGNHSRNRKKPYEEIITITSSRNMC